MAVDPAAFAALLDAKWPDPPSGLYARDPWERLAAIILAEGASDTQANRVMAGLCERLVGVAAWADLDHRVLAGRLAILPGHRAKARAVVEAARAVCRQHAGRVPDDPDVLRRLPGLGRALAGRLLDEAFGRPAVAAGAALRRVAFRLGWSPAPGARACVLAIESAWPEAVWSLRSRQIAAFAAAFCRRHHPRCQTCPLAQTCPSATSRP